MALCGEPGKVTGHSARLIYTLLSRLRRDSSRSAELHRRYGLTRGGNVPRLILGLMALVLSLGGTAARAQFSPPAGTGPGLPETVEAIDSARVTTRILYITAHPDDESATLLTYLARGLHADVALLTLTRGEGGQNDLGPEQAPQLGLIRTQELLAATRGYGIKLFFTRAPDFGFSKTTEETQRIWGDAVLGDMVRVVRTFRPSLVINGWGGVHGGHGHHQTAGLWTPRAVALAADAKAFPEQLQEGLAVWGPGGVAVPVLDTERGGASNSSPNGLTLPVDEISPLWGKTWREIALDAFANHRSQGITGFINSPFLRRPLVLIREDGQKLDASLLAQPLRELGTGSPAPRALAPALANADDAIAQAGTAALALRWQEAAKQLARAAETVRSLATSEPRDAMPAPLRMDLTAARERIERALALVAGIELRATADRDALVVGETFRVSAESQCRKQADCELGTLQLNLSSAFQQIKTQGDAEKGFEFTVQVEHAPPPLTTWDQLLPEPPPLIEARQDVTVAGYRFSVLTPVTHVAANSTRIDRVPLRVVPAYTLAVEPTRAIEVPGKQQKPFDVLLRVHSYSTQPAKIEVGLDPPDGFTASTPETVSFEGGGDRYVKLTVTPPAHLSAGRYPVTAYAKRGEEKFSTSIAPLPSLPTRFWESPATCIVEAFDINVPAGLRVGYIPAEGEPIPEALRMLGIRVENLDPQALAFSDLSKFDAIVVGVRAYELRSDLPGANQRLLDYVSRGGTLIVQYNRDFVWDAKSYAPYPAHIGTPTPRTTDETAAVTFLKPEDPLLNTPNKITEADFNGWVQERGLYYWKDFDPRYTALLAMHDPGEKDLNGALVYTKYGNGTYIYTGIAFFRQLPEGVPGAFRLFVNLLAASRSLR